MKICDAVNLFTIGITIYYFTIYYEIYLQFARDGEDFQMK